MLFGFFFLNFFFSRTQHTFILFFSNLLLFFSSALCNIPQNTYQYLQRYVMHSVIVDKYEMVRGKLSLFVVYEARHFRNSSFYLISQVCAISLTTCWHHILPGIHKPITNVWFCKSASHCQCELRSDIYINSSDTIILNYWTTDCCVTCLFCLKVNNALKKAVHTFVLSKLCSFICSPGCHFKFFLFFLF